MRPDPSNEQSERVTPRASTLAAPSFTLFESGQVRPLALSPDGQSLFAVNTPDNRLEVFCIQGHQLVHTASIPVGLEPVAVAARSNHDNLDRFEGPGTFTGHSLRGHLHESRITVLAPGSGGGGGSVTARHLNKHINYGSCCAPIPNTENARSLALPQQMAVTANGATLYVAALGSAKVGVFSTAQLEADTFVPSTASQVPVSGGGPTGIVLDEGRGQLYVGWPTTGRCTGVGTAPAATTRRARSRTAGRSTSGRRSRSSRAGSPIYWGATRSSRRRTGTRSPTSSCR
jgi:DNA-binding beta-propeller fold protein YncE